MDERGRCLILNQKPPLAPEGREGGVSNQERPVAEETQVVYTAPGRDRKQMASTEFPGRFGPSSQRAARPDKAAPKLTELGHE
jgi:hypothetical protein